MSLAAKTTKTVPMDVPAQGHSIHRDTKFVRDERENCLNLGVPMLDQILGDESCMLRPQLRLSSSATRRAYTVENLLGFEFLGRTR